MVSKARLLTVAVCLLAIDVARSSAYAAPPVCSADDLCDPAAAACTIGGAHDVDDGCVLDFGVRSLTVTGLLRAVVSGGSFAIEAGAIVLDGGRLRAPGRTVVAGSPDAGGTVTIQTTGPFAMRGNTSTIDVGGNGGGGFVEVIAASVEITAGSPAIDASGTDVAAPGGGIRLTATGEVRIGGVLDVDSGPGDTSASSATVEIEGSSVTIDGTVRARGGQAGSIVVGAAVDAVVIDPGGVLDASATDYVDDFGDHVGGAAGAVTISSPESIVLGGVLVADAPGPDGAAGSIEATSERGPIELAGTATSIGSGASGRGGSISVVAGSDLSVGGAIDASGGSSTDGAAGTVWLRSARDLSISPEGRVSARGETDGSWSITTDSAGSLTVAGLLDSSGTGAGTSGSQIYLGPHCQIRVDGTLRSRGVGGGDGGSTLLESPTIHFGQSAIVDVAPCTTPPLGATSSCNLAKVRNQAPTQDPGAVLAPPLEVVTDPAMRACCGNGVVDTDEAESCDDGNHDFCDGCTPRCESRPADYCTSDRDGNPCTGAICVPEVGCEPLTGTACTADTDACTDDVCREGECTHPSPCRDESTDPCRVGRCDLVAGCVFELTPAGAACSDDDPCTSGDACDGRGNCIGHSLAESNPCITVLTFNGSLCFQLENSPACPTSCDGEADGTPCADGRICTTGRCHGGTCRSEPTTCPAAAACSAEASCTELIGCTPSGPYAGGCSDDGDPCTAERCDPVLGCVSEPLTGNPCSDDDDACTTDVCRAGVCAHDSISCDDGDTCTVDRCEPARGCTHASACEPIRFLARPVKGKGEPPFPGIVPVGATDAFGSRVLSLKRPGRLAMPVDHEGPIPGAEEDPGHLTAYVAAGSADGPGFIPRRNLRIRGELGSLEVDVLRPDLVMLPSVADLLSPPAVDLAGRGALACYRVRTSRGAERFRTRHDFAVRDRFGATRIDVGRPLRLCTPASITWGGGAQIPPSNTYLLCHRSRVSAGEPPRPPIPSIFAADVLGARELSLRAPTEICLPATVE